MITYILIAIVILWLFRLLLVWKTACGLSHSPGLQNHYIDRAVGGWRDFIGAVSFLALIVSVVASWI